MKLFSAVFVVSISFKAKVRENGQQIKIMQVVLQRAKRVE